jgi:hypothetical protein
MAKRHAIEALYISLRDILGKEDLPFWWEDNCIWWRLQINSTGCSKSKLDINCEFFTA